MSTASNATRAAHHAVESAFPSSRAEKWVLAAALITALAYGFRRLIEPSVSSAPAQGGQVAQLLGTGSPPPPAGKWAIAYGVGFIALALMAELAPELAAALAGMEITGVVLGNANGIVTDLASLGLSDSSTSTSTSTSSSTSAANVADTATASGVLAGDTAAQAAARADAATHLKAST